MSFEVSVISRLNHRCTTSSPACLRLRAHGSSMKCHQSSQFLKFSSIYLRRVRSMSFSSEIINQAALPMLAKVTDQAAYATDHKIVMALVGAGSTKSSCSEVDSCRLFKGNVKPSFKSYAA
ncbi:hypothetical protein KP509_37G011500 [Ceratopteris richardii]|uniref:Uncharacterized protein n=1 Tax=Ceratopteris richardii TaxID=49495 RepID=A0A8T2Q5F5_CERRI|nr:hypothetical protein KP509_37G011500 [Ceratopteris richardii]